MYSLRNYILHVINQGGMESSDNSSQKKEQRFNYVKLMRNIRIHKDVAYPNMQTQICLTPTHIPPSPQYSFSFHLEGLQDGRTAGPQNLTFVLNGLITPSHQQQKWKEKKNIEI